MNLFLSTLGTGASRKTRKYRRIGEGYRAKRGVPETEREPYLSKDRIIRELRMTRGRGVVHLILGEVKSLNMQTDTETSVD